MSAVFVGYFEPGSPEWAAARATAIGGSEVAAVLGLSPFESRFSLWHRKRGSVGPIEETPEMEWGKRLEPAILAKFASQHPELWVDLSDERSPTLAHPDRPWQIACPDTIALPDSLEASLDDRPWTRLWDRGGPIVVEAKLSIFGDGWGESGTDQVPIYYRTQVLWYLDVIGAARAYLVVLIGGHDYREYVIERDDAECAELRQAVEQFLTEVARGQRPDIDAHTATYQVIRDLHPDIEPDEIVVSNDVAKGYIVAKAAEKVAKADARKATSLLADEMGNAHRATWDGITLATRQARGDGTPYVVAARGLCDQEPAA